MRVILVPVADRPECGIALNRTFAMARELGASVIGLHVTPPGDSGATRSESEWLALMRHRSRKNSVAAARNLFGRAAHASGYDLHKSLRAKPGAIWTEKAGSPNRALANTGPVADLLVVSRPEKRDGSVARLFVTAALLASARPVMVVPQAGEQPIGRRICVAWNQSTEAARAVAAALPMLQLAQRVTIVSAGPEKRPGPRSAQLASYLKCWGIKSERIGTPGRDDARELLGAYRANKCDLMVMGAYGRSRYSQMVLGGVTDYMLYRASIPVIMLHS